MFADFTNLDLSNDGVESPRERLRCMTIKRYLKHSVSRTRSMTCGRSMITTDFNYVSNDEETQLFIKKAYLQAKLSDAFVGRVGSADMPWIPFDAKRL